MSNLKEIKVYELRATENADVKAKLLKALVGAWGFEPRPLPCQVVLEWCNKANLLIERECW